MYYSNWNNYDSYDDGIKYCSLCREEFCKKNGESKDRWRKRLYCSIECYRKSRIPYPETKVCQKCGKKFERATTISYNEWEDRTYCSKKCAKESMAFKPQNKVCEFCNKTFDKKRKDSNYDWSKKKFCSLQCRKESDKKPWNDKENEIIKKYYEIGASQTSLLLPGRSINSIKKRAKELGIKLNKHEEAEELNKFDEFDFTSPRCNSYDMWD